MKKFTGEIGASFSHRHLETLGLSSLDAIKAFEKLGLTWIRLGCYWNEIEKTTNNFVFESLDPLVEFCEKKNIKVVMTVGMKAPRYPEYYIPDWVLPTPLPRLTTIGEKHKRLTHYLFRFIETVIGHYKNSSAVKIWQVENEPLDPSGQKWWRIHPDLLKKEVQLVKKLDKEREILVNLWGNELSKRQTYKKALDLADIVGLDLYPRHPIPFLKWFKLYVGPLDSKKTIFKISETIKSQKKLFLAELQAEPWEPGELTTSKNNPPSFRPNHFKQNLDYGKGFSPEVILLWGFEYWYWRKTMGDNRYWREAEKLLKA
ncbi:hypothetical protein A2801_02145 [Candidatus Woesebacteria bacterium RIFCSPHIGHO2_01_FULL_41_10]|uniref:Glycoside hydrolase family 42 N-terminal domain-containing protein n=1 Tax=Candidatus Woesebacteria bacterium RIFCSPHIGHO2_01_FULL_41_10 TaxID=1802500 RepID=A0A1F7YPN5_9BACT|nr:MAG: hypothetical protein A2801_02145 [Candidatus Woesebacteria bacterium RIFCSPHIGHO2_01_FULL_41_10]